MAYIPVIENARIAADAVTTDKVLNATLTDLDVAAANKDGAVGVPSLRTLGTGAGQALAGTTTLDAIAAPTSSVSLNSQTITNLADPTSAQDAATKAYVDAVASGLDPKASVLYTTTGNINLTGTATQGNGTWPGALTAGDRILVKDQTDPIENGIYDAAAGAWARSEDFDGTPASEVTNGAFTLVSADDGSAQVGTGWVVTSADPIVVDTDPIDFTQITSPGAVSVLNDLTDVDTTGVVTNAGLRFNGTNWVDTANILLDDAGKKIEWSAGQHIRDLGGGYTELEPGTLLNITGQLDIDGAFYHEQGGNKFTAAEVAGSPSLAFATDHIVVINSTAAARTVTLPSGASGLWFRVKRRGVNGVTIQTTGGQLIDGSATLSLNDKESFDLIFVGTEWQVF